MTPDLAGIFARTFCITLRTREDRWKHFQRRMRLIDWPFAPIESVEAINGEALPVPFWWRVGPGAWGCWWSHVRIWELAISYRWPAVLILEDDAEFVGNFADRATAFFAEVPADWQQIYFGGGATSDSRIAAISPLVARVAGIQLTHAYGIKLELLEQLYPYVFSAIGSRPGALPEQHIDQQMGVFQLQSKLRFYAPRPPLAGQAAEFSDIARRHTAFKP